MNELIELIIESIFYCAAPFLAVGFTLKFNKSQHQIMIYSFLGIVLFLLFPLAISEYKYTSQFIPKLIIFLSLLLFSTTVIYFTYENEAKTSFAAFLSVVIFISVILVNVFLIFGDAFGTKARTSKEWKWEGYTIIHKNESGFAGSPYQRIYLKKYILKDILVKNIDDVIIRTDTCIVGLSDIKAEKLIRFDFCEGRIISNKELLEGLE